MSNWNLPDEKQVDAEQRAKMLLKPGLYSFEVIEAKDETSQAGNRMIKLKVKVFPEDPNAKARFLYDYLTAALAYKVLHFCRETKQPDRYSNGDLTADDCLGKTGVCYVKIKVDKEGKYPDKNEIGDYGNGKKSQEEIDKVNGQTKMFEESTKPTSAAQPDLEDKDIPF